MILLYTRHHTIATGYRHHHPDVSWTTPTPTTTMKRHDAHKCTPMHLQIARVQDGAIDPLPERVKTTMTTRLACTERELERRPWHVQQSYFLAKSQSRQRRYCHVRVMNPDGETERSVGRAIYDIPS